MAGIIVCQSGITLLRFYQPDLIPILNNITLICSALLIYTLPRFSHSTNRVKRRTNIPFLAVSMTLILLLILSMNFNIIPKTTSIILILMGCAIAYSMIYMMLTDKKNSPKPNVHIKRLGLLSLIVLPGLTIMDLFPELFNLSSEFKKYFQVLPGFYLLLNIGLILALKGRYWGDQKDYTSFVSSFNISPRERDVMELLIIGDSYKTIGEKLSISLSTVKSHISNLYQKTNTSNKVELITLVQKY